LAGRGQHDNHNCTAICDPENLALDHNLLGLADFAAGVRVCERPWKNWN